MRPPTVSRIDGLIVGAKSHINTSGLGFCVDFGRSAMGKIFETILAMDDSELFDVFNVDNNPEPETKAIPTQVVVDSFETESDQIVPATQGLQGIAPTDQNIVIKKRVLHALTITDSTVSTCSRISYCGLEIHTPRISSICRSSC